MGGKKNSQNAMKTCQKRIKYW